ncbi:MAG: hypothetical protein U0527_10165 [Candidatus Eisenbacteria bacterium]
MRRASADRHLEQQLIVGRPRRIKVAQHQRRRVDRVGMFEPHRAHAPSWDSIAGLAARSTAHVAATSNNQAPSRQLRQARRKERGCDEPWPRSRSRFSAGSVLSSTASGANGDGTVKLRWTEITDLRGLLRAAEQGDGERRAQPCTKYGWSWFSWPVPTAPPLAAEEEQAGAAADRNAGRVVRVPSGERVSGELSEVGGAVLRRWALSIAPEATTKAALDLGSLTLELENGQGSPFGQWQSWSSRELERVPGAGEESIRRLDPLGPAVANLDGATIGLAGRLRPRIVNLESSALAYATPLGATSAALDGFEPWLLSGRTPGSGLPDIAISYMGGAAARHRAALRAGVRRDRPLPSLGLLGPIEATADLELETSGDAGPLGIAGEKLEHNQWDAATARLDLRFRPGGAPVSGAPVSRGLARLAFYASADKREYALAEFRRDPDHAPLEKRADVSMRGAYDFALAGLDFSAGANFRRSFLESGDGDAFDLFDQYRTLSGNTAVTDDGLYWDGESSGGGASDPHIWNYYLRDLTTGASLSLEAARNLGRHSARAGVVRRELTWRTFEHLDPISSFRGVNGGGFEYSNNLGYSIDGDAQAERPGAAARHPVWTEGFATDRWGADRVALEVGLRARHFRGGQSPLLDLDAPSGADTLLDASDLGPSRAEKSLEPRVGLALSIDDRTEAWLDFGMTRLEPPLEARYYSNAAPGPGPSRARGTDADRPRLRLRQSGPRGGEAQPRAPRRASRRGRALGSAACGAMGSNRRRLGSPRALGGTRSAPLLREWSEGDGAGADRRRALAPRAELAAALALSVGSGSDRSLGAGAAPSRAGQP